MNNRYLASLLCITALTFAPACTKRSSYAESYEGRGKKSSKEDINTMIELENEIFEMEETTDEQQSIVKF
jgi:hypothetical protein